jgi:DNA topoisomerase-2
LVIKGEIKINNVPMDKIIKQLQSNGLVELNGSYNYLLNIPIYKLSKDELDKLKSDFSSVKEQLKELYETNPEKMWHKDLVTLKSTLRKYRNE